MKMIIATTIAEYREQLHTFFSKQDVPFYNEFEIKGIDNSHQKTHRVENWFSGGSVPLEHIAFFSLVNDELANNILDNIDKYKNEIPNCNIKAYVLNVERTI